MCFCYKKKCIQIRPNSRKIYKYILYILNFEVNALKHGNNNQRNDKEKKYF